MTKKRVVAGIDVGTTKICTAIADVTDDEIVVLGTGWASSKGLRKGVVVNLSDTIASVRQSLEKAEAESNIVVESAYVSVGGGYLRSRNCAGEIEVRSKNGRVSGEDVARAVERAKATEIPADYEIIHVLTQSFSLDGQPGVINPLGMTGNRLSVYLHLVLNASAIVQNIANAINKSDVVVNGVVMQQLASSEAVLTEDEKELGTVLLDIGGGTTDISVYSQGSIWHSEVLPIGGSLITKDIAIGLKAPLQDAEQIKKNFGSLFPRDIPEEEVVEVPEMGTGKTRMIPRRLVCQIVEARCEELLEATAQVIRRVGVRPELVSGVVITGGGALLRRLGERAQEILDMPVRLGIPAGFQSRDPEIFHPAYSTALGLLKYARDLRGEQAMQVSKSVSYARPRAVTERFRNWIFERI